MKMLFCKLGEPALDLSGNKIRNKDTKEALCNLDILESLFAQLTVADFNNAIALKQLFDDIKAANPVSAYMFNMLRDVCDRIPALLSVKLIWLDLFNSAEVVQKVEEEDSK